MDTYPTGLSPHTPEEGIPTPTHGGMVSGPEYDVPITQKPSTSPTPPASLPPPPPAEAQNMDRPERTERHAQARGSSSAQRPRPVSMPPQAYAPPPANGGERDQRYDDGRHGREGSSSGKSRSGTRILGDYTLSKTLGAGSMGKVKLAHHNNTGEKVRPPDGLRPLAPSPLSAFLAVFGRLPTRE